MKQSHKGRQTAKFPEKSRAVDSKHVPGGPEEVMETESLGARCMGEGRILSTCQVKVQVLQRPEE